MFIKSLAAAAVIAAGLGMAADDAAAKTNVHIGIGVPGVCLGYGCGYWQEPYPPRYSYYNPGYYRYGYNYAYPYNSYGYGYYQRPRVAAYRISCREARRILQRNGWRNVDANDCGGRTYSFTGWKNGRAYLVSVSARSGAIVGRRRI